MYYITNCNGLSAPFPGLSLVWEWDYSKCHTRMLGGLHVYLPNHGNVTESTWECDREHMLICTVR